MSAVAVVGLGGMGRSMTKRLLAQGHDVTVWNRTPDAATELIALGAQWAPTMAEVFATGPVVSMLANDTAALSVFSEEVLAAAPPGAVHVNMGTISLAAAQTLTERHAAGGVGYLAVPVLGRPPVAEQGQLNLLAAGDPALIDSVEPLLTSLGKKTWRLGDQPWQANVAKIAMNYLLIHSLQAMAEAQSLAELHGLDNGVLVDLTEGSFFPGPVYSGYGRMIAEKRYLPAGFTTELGAKDLRLAQDAAAAVDLEMPTAPVLRDVFDQAIDLGLADHDWASIAEVTRQRVSAGGAHRAETAHHNELDGR